MNVLSSTSSITTKVITTPAPQNGTGNLTVTPFTGSSPLNVSIAFPKDWQDLANRLCKTRDISLTSRETSAYSDVRTLTID